MDDAKIHSGHPAGIEIVLLDGDRGGDRQPQPTPIGQQRDRADVLGRIGERAGQPHPQLGLPSCDGQPHSASIQQEGAVVEADWDQGALAPREPNITLASLAALGGLKPGVAVALEDRPCAHRGQLPERSRPSQLAAQRLVPGHRMLALLVTLPVAVQQPRPHVPGRAQQSVAARGLPAGEAQADRGGAMQQARSGGDGHGEHMFNSRDLAVKDGSRCCGQPSAAPR
jgi:hypothetical protein